MGTSASWRPAPAALRLAPHTLIAALLPGLCIALLAPAPTAVLSVAAVICGATAVVATRRHRPRLALVLLGVALFCGGWAWGDARLEMTHPPSLDLPSVVSGTVSVGGPPAPTGDGRARIELRAERLTGPGGRIPPGTRLLSWIGGSEIPSQGAVLEVRGRLGDAASEAAPGWWRAYLSRRRIAARIDLTSSRTVGRRHGLHGMRLRWRAWTGAHAATGLSGDRRAVVRGMALGGGAELSDRAARQLRDAGVWHLLAVSGQNVTVVALAVLGVLRALGVGRRPALAGAITALLAYCLACDGGASVGRAGVVGALGLLGELRSLERMRWHLLLVALAALLAADPRALGDPGLQLSFAAVLGLFVTAPPMTGFFEGWLPARIAQLAGIAAGAGLATAPVVVWHFERLSIAGLAVNVLAVPLAGPVVVIALIGIPAAALHPLAGECCAQVAALGADAILAMAALSSAAPGAAVDLPRAVAPALIVLPALPVLAPRIADRVPRRALRAAFATLAATAIGALLTAGSSPRPWPAEPELRVLDVGQGNATLLRDPAGRAVLIDTGPPGRADPLGARLAALGVRRLDALVLSHGSQDHVGGLERLLERSAPRLAALGPEIPPEQRRRLQVSLRARGVAVRTLAAGGTLRIGSWALEVVSPHGSDYRGGDPNPRSLVLLARAAGARALITSDAESPALAGIPLPPVDLMVVAHHGSRDAGLRELLARIRPRAAAISVGAGNTFGHPAAETLAAIRDAGVPVRRTDLSGDVWLRARRAGSRVGTG